MSAPGPGVQRWSGPERRRAVLARQALLAFVLAACGEDNTYVPPPPPAVTVSSPVQQTVTDYIELTGNTQASKSVALSPGSKATCSP